jgi:hypothetical protein
MLKDDLKVEAFMRAKDAYRRRCVRQDVEPAEPSFAHTVLLVPEGEETIIVLWTADGRALAAYEILRPGTPRMRLYPLSFAHAVNAAAGES